MFDVQTNDVGAVTLLETPTDSASDVTAAPSESEESALVPIPLRSIRAVARHIPAIDAAHAKITEEMESMVLTGLATLVRNEVSR
jgi:hypothetical protein